MREKLTVTGMVILAAPMGDFDKRVVILTKERGKITAFARGARRQNSTLLAAANPFTFGEFEVYEGRGAYNLSKATVKQYFRELANQPQTACYGFYFLELVNYYARENNDEIELLKLLYQSVKALLVDTLDNALIRVIFELKIMVVNGEYPNVFSCKKCNSKDNLAYFKASEGGVFCSACGSKIGGIHMETSTVYALQYIVSSSIEKLYTFQVSETVLKELIAIMKAFMSRYIDRSFVTLAILEQEKGIIS
ncbi:MAG: DNA repair protein RecO [Lachnospiraceae bacterium]